MPSEVVETAKSIGVVFSAIMGGIALMKLVFSPLYKRYKAWREIHPPFRKAVLHKLERLQDGVERNADFVGALTRERLEGAYTLYVGQMGWCPKSEKALLHALYDKYRESGLNHLSEKYMQEIFDLPEYPPNVRHIMEEYKGKS